MKLDGYMRDYDRYFVENKRQRELVNTIRDEKDTASIGGKRHLLLKRYLREARARRNRAFHEWCAVAAMDNRAAA